MTVRALTLFEAKMMEGEQVASNYDGPMNFHITDTEWPYFALSCDFSADGHERHGKRIDPHSNTRRHDPPR